MHADYRIGVRWFLAIILLAAVGGLGYYVLYSLYPYSSLFSILGALGGLLTIATLLYLAYCLIARKQIFVSSVILIVIVSITTIFCAIDLIGISTIAPTAMCSPLDGPKVSCVGQDIAFLLGLVVGPTLFVSTTLSIFSLRTQIKNRTSNITY